MAVKKGYKQTEVGVIPEDWEAVPLPKVCTLQRGFDLTEATRVHGSVPVYSSSGISYFHNNARVQPPGVVTGRKGLLGKVFLVNEPFWPHDTTLWVKDFKGNHPPFVALILESFHLERLDAATSVPTLNRNNLAAYSVPFPPTLAEQEAIAGALSDADAWIESLEQLIAKKRQIKQGAMQELLTGKRRLPGFSGGWRESFLKEIVECSPSGTYGLDRQSLGLVAIPVATTAQISNDDRWNGKSMNSRYFTLEQAETYGVKQGDLIVVKSSGSAASIQSGKMVLVDSELSGSFLFSNFLMRLRPRTVGSHFLYYYLTSSRIKKMLPSLCEASTYPNIRINEYLEIRVPLPSIAEQTAIATVLSDMDTEIESLESKLAKAREVKQGMMQELLTGRIRLV